MHLRAGAGSVQGYLTSHTSEGDLSHFGGGDWCPHDLSQGFLKDKNKSFEGHWKPGLQTCPTFMWLLSPSHETKWFQGQGK